MSHRETDAENILKLIAERDKFLAEPPELKPFQKEIDSALHQAGSNPKMRLIKLVEIITGVINDELKPELVRLKELIDKTEPAKVLPLRRKAK